MTRGDVVTVATGSGFGSKPRPALVVQADAVTTSTVIVAPFTSDLNEAMPVRPIFEPSATNGLERRSELMADLLVTARREKVGRVLGRLGPAEMSGAERALITVLGLAG